MLNLMPNELMEFVFISKYSTLTLRGKYILSHSGGIKAF